MLSRMQLQINPAGWPTRGYFAGGSTSSNAAAAATTDQIVFATDVTAAKTTANLTVGLVASGPAASNVAGYFAAGGTAAGTGGQITANKTVFATETTGASTASDLAGSVRGSTAGASSPTSGYFAGGTNSTSQITGEELGTANKLTFATDVTALLTSADLPSGGKKAAAGVASGTDAYFIAGGNGTQGQTVTNTSYKMPFSTDTTAASTASNLSLVRQALKAVRGNTIGIIAGGSSAGTVSTPSAVADRLTFSTDVSAAQTLANLSVVRNRVGSASSLVSGYFAGGASGVNSGTGISSTDKCVMATETTAAQTTADLTALRSWNTGVPT